MIEFVKYNYPSSRKTALIFSICWSLPWPAFMIAGIMGMAGHGRPNYLTLTDMFLLLTMTFPIIQLFLLVPTTKMMNLNETTKIRLVFISLLLSLTLTISILYVLVGFTTGLLD